LAVSTYFLFVSMTGCRNFQKKIDRDVTFKTTFAITLSVFGYIN